MSRATTPSFWRVDWLKEGTRKSPLNWGADPSERLDHDVAEEIARLWRLVVERTEFLRQLVSSIRIRNGMESDALQAHIAYSARQPSSGTSKTGAATVIEILRLAGIVAERDGTFVATRLVGVPEEQEPNGDGVGVAEQGGARPWSAAPSPVTRPSGSLRGLVPYPRECQCRMRCRGPSASDGALGGDETPPLVIRRHRLETPSIDAFSVSIYGGARRRRRRSSDRQSSTDDPAVRSRLRRY